MKGNRMLDFETGRGNRDELLEKAHEEEIEEARVLFVGGQVLNAENITVEAEGHVQEQARQDYETEVREHAERLRTKRDAIDLEKYGNSDVLKNMEQSNN